MNHSNLDVALHARLLARDPIVPVEVCDLHLTALVQALGRRHSHVCPLLIEQAVHDALLDYFKHPGKYNPARSPLRSYLLLAARRDLFNALRGEARHQRDRGSPVELSELQGNQKRGGPPLEELILREELAIQEAWLEPVRASCSSEERAVLDLMLQSERTTGRFAEALGLLNLPEDQQEREVKRIKDRLKKRLQRRVDHGTAGGDGKTCAAGPVLSRLVARPGRAS